GTQRTNDVLPRSPGYRDAPRMATRTTANVASTAEHSSAIGVQRCPVMTVSRASGKARLSEESDGSKRTTSPRRAKRIARIFTKRQGRIMPLDCAGGTTPKFSASESKYLRLLGRTLEFIRAIKVRRSN